MPAAVAASMAMVLGMLYWGGVEEQGVADAPAKSLCHSSVHELQRLVVSGCAEEAQGFCCCLQVLLTCQVPSTALGLEALAQALS